MCPRIPTALAGTQMAGRGEYRILLLKLCVYSKLSSLYLFGVKLMKILMELKPFQTIFVPTLVYSKRTRP
jgi:hypothetical protein